MTTSLRGSRRPSSRPSASKSLGRSQTKASCFARWRAPRRRSPSTTTSSRGSRTLAACRQGAGQQGRALSELGRSEEAVAVYDDVLTRYADATEPKLREAVANALSTRARCCVRWGAETRAVAAYDELIVRLADATEPVIRDRIATGTSTAGRSLASLVSPYAESVVHAGGRPSALKAWTIHLRKERRLRVCVGSALRTSSGGSRPPRIQP